MEFHGKKRKWNLYSPFNEINYHIKKIKGTEQFTLNIYSAKDSSLLKNMFEI